MFGDLAKMLRGLACLLLAIGLALTARIGSTFAGDAPPVDQIINALKPHLTRSLDTSTPRPSATAPNQESQFVDSLRNRTARSITFTERENLATITPKRQGIDLEINFEYGSAKLAPAAMATAKNIGEALSSAELAGSTFVVEGHTDAKGSAKYNQRLSDQRADAVKRFLIEQYKIPASNLVAVGYGKSKLKNPNDPLAAENRRVRVVNMAANVANE
jgi:outer membrane protein OmpA-like peptidoglycan-associated protein